MKSLVVIVLCLGTGCLVEGWREHARYVSDQGSVVVETHSNVVGETDARAYVLTGGRRLLIYSQDYEGFFTGAEVAWAPGEVAVLFCDSWYPRIFAGLDLASGKQLDRQRIESIMTSGLKARYGSLSVTGDPLFQSVCKQKQHGQGEAIVK